MTAMADTTPATTPWFGVHTGLQRTSTDELIALWHRIEELGFDWISIWDHFYAADASGDPDCLEAVACHAALATVTERVRCGSLVYSAGYRHPAVLANALATIDHLSGGRAVLGMGGGWLENEYRVYGIDYPSPGTRLRRLGESIQCVQSLLNGDGPTDFDGEFFHLEGAQCVPRPVQAHLPVWVGGGGEKVTLRIAAEHADGWNIPFVSPEAWAHKSRILDEHCAAVGRDPKAVARTVNVGIAQDDDDLRAQFAGMAEFVRPGVLVGVGQQLVDRVGEYLDAGAEAVILAMRTPFDLDALDRFADTVLPAFA
jgi:F420-dependent oxidoreductase-like protein